MNPINSAYSIMEAKGVSFGYPGTDKKALRELNLCLPKGKKTAICGHNGSGKSTFFLHAIGIHRPSSGQMLWRGSALSYRPNDLKTLRQQIGLVFQDPEQQLILNTPYEDVTFGLRNAGMSEPNIRLRAGNTLDAMGLASVADTPIHHLSLGLKKRVALAGVLALEPELLLLDEPTAYLDRASERQLVDELNRIHASGVTVAMATHDMNLAYAWADWILVMEQGQCVMQGTPQQVFEDRDAIVSLGLELPMLLELWYALPEFLREGTPPRSVEHFKQLVKKPIR
ncbi:energy-coupling factor ABC transporter ATP-binding protein [Paenibacillus allorhizosphaerae]|uniref:Cobalt import ATP-binding protein CbiO n=1 Tax=Paenibacillus allorhizosphaerae TaxID=2849866 RepID=A0ABM8VF88_9BACL|nr:ABC transporter ATP-binding protein [Paenibacillus allorhizosphaerae]CAG7634082.1 Cobalt import ATP-binding protein CbiO [Paenibacillus allorhizosphaerae]